jgi:uncharacterized cupin superfamily protein
MSAIVIETAPDATRLANLGVDRWPEWSSQSTEFPWEYFEQEMSYIVEGRAIVTPEGGAPVEIAKGDLVTFPSELLCKWKVIEPLRKRYRIG